MTHEKLCLCCKHFEIDFGSTGYSDMTPGCPMYCDCKMRHYKTRKHRYVEDYDELIQLAKTCKDFKHR
jgi:hypothetical protein